MRMSFRPLLFVLALALVLCAAVPVKAQESAELFGLRGDLFRSTYVASDAEGQRFTVCWPDGVSEAGLQKTLDGGWVLRVLYIWPLTDPDHRRGLYTDLLSALALEPGRSELLAVDFHEVLAELDGPSGARLQETEKFAVAFEIVAGMDVHSILESGTLTRVANTLRQDGRTLRHIMQGRHFTFATTALRVEDIALTADNPVAETVMLNALASDRALERLDEMATALLPVNADPELIVAFDQALERLEKNQVWWNAFASSASNRASGTGAGLTADVLSGQVVEAFGAKAGDLVSSWVVPLALNSSEYGRLTDPVDAIQSAMLAGIMAQDLQRAESGIADYAAYHFYYEMMRAVDGWLARSPAFLSASMGWVAEHYESREEYVRELALGPGASFAPLPPGMPTAQLALGVISELEVDRSLEVEIDDPGPGREVVFFIAPDYYKPAEVTVGDTTLTLDEDRQGIFALGRGDTVLLESYESVALGVLALSARRVTSHHYETGDMSEYRISIEGTPGYTFALVIEGEPDQRVSVDFMSNDFDAFLVGSSPGGSAIDDDDGGEGYNARLEMQLDAEGRGVVIANSLDQDPGSYELVVESWEDTPVHMPYGGYIEPDSTVTGAIGPNDWIDGDLGVLFEVPVAGGREVTIELISDDFDAFLFVESPDYRDHEDDDGGSGTNSRLVFTPTNDGPATIFVTSYYGDEIGDFLLRVQSEGEPGRPAQDGPYGIYTDAQPLILRNGQGVGYGNVSTGEEVFSFDIDRPTDVTITVVVTRELEGTRYSDDDSKLFLFDEQWRLVDQDDDGGEGMASMLEDVWLARPGRYYAVVTTYPNAPDVDDHDLLLGFQGDGGSNIDFELHVSSTGGGTSYRPSGIGLDTTDHVRVDRGTAWASGNVGTGYAAYELTITERGWITIEVIVTQINQGTQYADDDSMLFLFDADGLLVEENDDGGEGRASLIENLSLAPGTYYAVVTTYPNRPVLRDGGVLEGFEMEGESNMDFDLRVELE